MGFAVGMFAPVIGVVTTTIAMVLWARTDDEYEGGRRRRHAISVAIWSVFGSLLTIVLVGTLISALITAAAHNIAPTDSALPLP
jgi:uncharacterized membrane protein YidH (DUF202 family)